MRVEWRWSNMFLSPEKSLCEKNQKLVVSRDKGASREHRAENPQGQCDLRHYRLDGDLVQHKKCCDYLLVNDSKKKAYLIELKGGNIDVAVEQLEAGERFCEEDLKEYIFFYRIVCSKAKTHKIESIKVRKFKEKKLSRVIIKENRLTEKLD